MAELSSRTHLLYYAMDISPEVENGYLPCAVGNSASPMGPTEWSSMRILSPIRLQLLASPTGPAFMVGRDQQMPSIAILVTTLCNTLLSNQIFMPSKPWEKLRSTNGMQLR